MVTRSDGDALGIQKGGYVVRVDAVDSEGNDGGLAGRISMNGEAGKGFHSGGGMLEQGLLVGNGRDQIEGAEVFDGGPETDGALDVGRARLEALGWGSESGFLEGHFVDHVASALIGRHVGEQFSLAVKDSDAHGSEYLVPRKGEKVAIDVAEVDWPMRNALGTVDHGDDATFLGFRYYCRYGVDRAERVGNVAEREKLDLWLVEQRAEGVAVERSILKDGGDLDLDPRLFLH